jgi:IPT/TIG domain
VDRRTISAAPNSLRRLCSGRAAALLLGAALLAGSGAVEFPLAGHASSGPVVHVASSALVPHTVSGAPAVSAINPNSGSTAGGTAVIIYGTGFTSATTVKFGTVDTSCGGSGGFFVISDTQISVISPAGALGSVDVVVVGPGGSSPTGVQDRFTYVNPTIAVVNGISPNSGSTAGGTLVTLNGVGFTNATQVLFGTTTVFAFAPSDTLIQVNSPPEPAGPVDVTVVNPSGVSATTPADRFTFTTPGTPVVRAVTPNSTTAAGGTQIVIIGSGFSAASAVHFGTTALGPGVFSVSDDNHIFVTVPPGTQATTVDVTVTTPAGTSVATNADKFSYLAPTAPVVRAVVINRGPAIGGTAVDLIGSGFSGATAVKFGANMATGLLIGNDSNLSITSPLGAVGTVDITITTPVGTSAISTADHFTYVTTPVPVVYGIAPNSGTTAGQTFVLIFGSGFTGMTSVHFGTTAATTNLAVLADGEIDVFYTPAGAAGTVDVTVTTPGGTSAASVGDKYTYVAAGLPVVNSVSPNHGAAGGGSYIELVGSGFTGVTTVHFGTVAETGINAFSDTQITVYIPAGSGTVDVTVTTPVGTSSVSPADKFTYVTPAAPVVTAISPSSGPASGGTGVWISGSALSTASSVMFGTATATSFTVVSDNVVEVLGSAAGTGTVNVTVTTAGGTSAVTTADQFTYTASPQPAIISASPSTGPASGGSTVYVSGSGFAGASAVNFGSNPAVFFVNDGNLITATSPAGSGTVNITVVGPGGTSPTTVNGQFTYTAASPSPTVTVVSPSSGSAAGGSTVYITGTNFTGATTVNFGSNAAGFIVSSDNLITVPSTPGGTVGLIDVTVVKPSGTSGITPNDHYTYVAPLAPTVTGVSPATGPSAGGTTAWITGTGFTGAGAVSFGTIAAAGFSVVSDNLIVVPSPAGSGTVNITVTTPGGPSATSSNDQFIYGGPPPSGLQVNGVSPNRGPAAGGTNVQIYGMGFTGATAVKFGTIAASGFFVSADTQIFATSPPGTAGSFDVTVTAGASTSVAASADHFTFTAPVTVTPIVSAVDPNHGSSAGGTSVNIFGSGFSGATTVKFGSSPASAVFVSSDAQLTATSPAGPAGTSVHVTVTNSAGTSATSSADSFTYASPGPPVVNAVDPRSGTTLGGTTVTLFGSGFSGVTSVMFGTTGGVFPAFSSDSQIFVTTPGGVVGSVDVTVTTPGGTSATSNADRFTYVAPGTPVVSAVSPNQGGTAGGRLVRIFGTGLSGATGANFGTAAATSFSFISDSEFDVISPPGAVGTVHITVTTPRGVSTVGAADQYTYFVASAPSITAVSPTSGAAGTQVFITGTGLSDVTSVFFGNVCVLGFFGFFNGTDTSLQVSAPPGPSGTVDVTVISPDGTSAITVNDHFTYTAAPLPTVTYVAPASGPSGGGTTVFITGTGLSGVTGAVFGSAPALQSSGLFALTDNLIEATSPAGTNGSTVDVLVTTPGGTSAINTADHYTYGPTPAPSVTVVSPNSGPSGGGATVYLTGSGFLTATQVNVGTNALSPCFLFGPLTPGRGGSSPTSTAPNRFPSVQLPTAIRIPIHDPTRSGRTSTPRFAAVLVPSVAHRLFTGLAQRPALPRRPAQVAPDIGRGGPPQCTSGFFALSDNVIQLFSPPGAVGTVDVTVTGPGGTSPTSAADHYTYVATPAPVVSAVSPSGGPSGGGTTVYVSGSNLSNASAVQFGGVSAPIQSDPFLAFFSGTGDSLIEVLSPAGTNPSTVHVTVTTAGGTSATSTADQFTYGFTPAPSVSAVSPSSGPIGTTVFITGSGFLGSTAVDFGTVTAGLGFSVISDTLIQATSPSHALGLVDVKVVTPGGTSSTIAADHYTYTASPTPVVTAVSPASGAAGTVVYVTGSGLSAASAVAFGSASATFVFYSDTLIQATSPAGSGLVDVTVTTAGGTSATSTADKFTYTTTTTTTALASSSNPSTVGSSVTYTATVTPSPDGGTMAFTDNAATLTGCGAVAVNTSTGKATCTTSYSAVGSHAIAAGYSGDTNYAASSGGLTQQVNAVLSCPTAASVPATGIAASTNQYTLHNSNGTSWQEIDATNLRLTCLPTANQSTLLTANADLWTANAGYNQDLGIFVSDNGGADQLLAWKESGGFAGTFSPNAAYIQDLYNMTSGHSYVFKLKWKTNKPASGATIVAGAGTGPYSPTSLVAETFPTGVIPNFAVSTTQYTLPNSDGAIWQAIDAVNLSTTLSPGANATAVLGGNADLWTANAGYNQDIGIFVSDNGGADSLVAWKESGGFAGTFSPNAAFVKATYAMTGGHTYAFKLKWKTNKPAPGATIVAGAGTGPYSPTSLLAESIAAGANPYTAVSTSQYTLSNSDGATWQPIDAAVNVTVTPGANTNSILGANADLWTANAGYNQDLGIFVSDNGGADVLLAWKESGGFAGTYSPNAAFAQATYQMTSGHTYVFKLKWKTNKNAPGTTIVAGAGTGPYSPTRLTVELTN